MITKELLDARIRVSRRDDKYWFQEPYVSITFIDYRNATPICQPINYNNTSRTMCKELLSMEKGKFRDAIKILVKYGAWFVDDQYINAIAANVIGHNNSTLPSDKEFDEFGLVTSKK